MLNWRKENILLKFQRRNVLEMLKTKTVVEKPKLLGIYSYNYEIFEPAKYIKYFKEPEPKDYPMDLNEGYSTSRFTLPCTYDSRLHAPLTFAVTNGVGKMSQVEARTQTIVYTSRRVLSKLLECCYSKEDFKLWVTRFNGMLYMVGELSYIDNKPQHNHHERLDKILFAESPNEEPKRNEPIDTNVSLSCLHCTNLERFSLLYAGDIQGIISNEKLDSLNNMDVLNQCRFVLTKQMWEWSNKEYKFLRYWIQSRLSNVEDIYVAYKNENGIVEKPIEHCKVSEIPKNYSWRPEICFGFLHKFLENVDNLMHDVNSLETVYEFESNARNKEITYNIYRGRTDKTFIPKYYADFVSK
ncbi:uncharacterized protein LOC101895847 [Musca domestica]|uniref:Decapping nuclease n=1 Tax=Musca domestica TaxID=7370 RepID=A0A9J7I491_MUSDO|nr:uncharacterized protein LOC101895847 [Musca domestica]